MFADDTTILNEGKDVHESLKVSLEKLDNIRAEFAAHGLLLNNSKTQMVHFTNFNHTTVRETISSVDSAKFLGIKIDRNLSWKSHISDLIKKLNSALFVIRRLSQVCEKETAIQAFHALLMSHINYGILAWGGCHEQQMTAILRLQKRGIRHLLGLGRGASCKDHFKSLKVFTVPALYIYKCIMYIAKVPGNQPKLGDNHSYGTRMRGAFKQETHRTALFERNNPSYQGVRFLRALPLELQRLFGSNKFKGALKSHLLNLAPYKLTDLTEILL